jgi:hypothetical protein
MRVGRKMKAYQRIAQVMEDRGVTAGRSIKSVRFFVFGGSKTGARRVRSAQAC